MYRCWVCKKYYINWKFYILGSKMRSSNLNYFTMTSLIMKALIKTYESIWLIPYSKIKRIRLQYFQFINVDLPFWYKHTNKILQSIHVLLETSFCLSSSPGRNEPSSHYVHQLNHRGFAVNPPPKKSENVVFFTFFHLFLLSPAMGAAICASKSWECIPRVIRCCWTHF